MQKAYQRIHWRNYPSIDSPVNEHNLNKMDLFNDIADNRILSLNLEKMDKSEAANLISGIDIDRATGIITITKYSGAIEKWDTLLEKIIVNVDFDSTSQRLVLTLDDGTEKYADLSSFITEYEFESGNTVLFNVENGKVKADIAKNSITEDMLESKYLALIKIEASKAENAAGNAELSEQNTKRYEANAKTNAANAAASAALAGDRADAAEASASSASICAYQTKLSEINTARSEANAQNSARQAGESASTASVCAYNAKSSEINTARSEKNAFNSAAEAESWVHGGRGVREGEDTDNSKYWSEQAKNYKELSENLLDEATQILNEANEKVADVSFGINYETGDLECESAVYEFEINEETGELEWE